MGVREYITENLFGFEIKKKAADREEKNRSFVPPTEEDGAVVVQSNLTGTSMGTFIDLEGTTKSEIEQITRYREASTQPELERAIDHIINEAIVTEDNGHSVKVVCDELKQPDKIKKKIIEEFEDILRMMNFGQIGHDIFRRWYVDGRFYYHVIIDEKNPKNGILELRYVDPRRIRKIREINREKDPKSGIDIIKTVREYFLYNERGLLGSQTNLGAKIAVDSISVVTSGLVDPRSGMVISYIQKALKSLNDLRRLEDSVVIYRLVRAPERRIHYVDVSNMTTIKSEEYIKKQMQLYRNKVVYDSDTGTIRDDRNILAMQEDYWVPRKDGKNAEIDTLQGGQNLGEIEDVRYFKKRLYEALNVPISRLDPEQQGFNFGVVTEITRDELHFHKFISRMRNKFSTLFDELLRVQCVTKGICTEDEWEEFKNFIWYDWIKDNNIEEIKEAELFRNRLGLLADADQYVGRYFSKEHIQKKILMLDEDEIKEMDKQIEKEAKEGKLPADDGFGNPVVPSTGGGQPPPPPMEPEGELPPEEEEAPQDAPPPKKQAEKDEKPK